MGILRSIVIVVGLIVALIGIYILFLGVGAPIEIKSLEIGHFKASLAGIGSGAFISATGIGIMIAAMKYMKKTEIYEIERETTRPDGVKERIFTRQTIKHFKR